MKKVKAEDRQRGLYELEYYMLLFLFMFIISICLFTLLFLAWLLFIYRYLFIFLEICMINFCLMFLLLFYHNKSFVYIFNTNNIYNKIFVEIFYYKYYIINIVIIFKFLKTFWQFLLKTYNTDNFNFIIENRPCLFNVTSACLQYVNVSCKGLVFVLFNLLKNSTVISCVFSVIRNIL